MKYFIVLFFVSYVAVMAQSDVQPTVIVSKVFNDEKYKTSLIFAEEDINGDIYVVRDYLNKFTAPIGYYLERYDNDLNLLNRIEIPIERSELHAMILDENEVKLIEFRYVQAEKGYKFIGHRIKKSDFSVDSTELWSFDRSDIKKYEFFGMRKDLDYGQIKFFRSVDVSVSNDKSHIALQRFKNQEEGYSFEVMVLDSDFEFIYTSNVGQATEVKGHTTKRGKIFTIKFEVDNNGIVIHLGKVIPRKKEKKTKGPDFYYEVMSISDNIPISIKLDPGEKDVNSPFMIQDDQYIYCVGIYPRDKEEAGEEDLDIGTVWYKIDKKSMTISDEVHSAFTEDFNFDKYGDYLNRKGAINWLKKLLNQTKDGNIDPAAGVYYQTDIAFSEDGGIIINGEEYIRVVTGGYGYAHTSNTYSDILICKIDNNGKLVWSRNVNKRQLTDKRKEIPFMSYMSHIDEGGVVVLMNADSEPKELSDDRIEYKTRFRKPINLLAVVIDDSGKRTDIDSNKLVPASTLSELRYSVQLSKNSYLIELNNEEGKPQLMRLSF